MKLSGRMKLQTAVIRLMTRRYVTAIWRQLLGHLALVLALQPYHRVISNNPTHGFSTASREMLKSMEKMGHISSKKPISQPELHGTQLEQSITHSVIRLRTLCRAKLSAERLKRQRRRMTRAVSSRNRVHHRRKTSPLRATRHVMRTPGETPRAAQQLERLWALDS